MASTMLSAAIKRQYSSVLPLLHHCLPVFDEICGTAINFVFFVQVTLVKIIKIMNTTLDRSATLVLSVINWTYCSCSGIGQIQLEIWPEPDLVEFPKNGQIPDHRCMLYEYRCMLYVEYRCQVYAARVTAALSDTSSSQLSRTANLVHVFTKYRSFLKFLHQTQQKICNGTVMTYWLSKKQ